MSARPIGLRDIVRGRRTTNFLRKRLYLRCFTSRIPPETLFRLRAAIGDGHPLPRLVTGKMLEIRAILNCKKPRAVAVRDRKLIVRRLDEGFTLFIDNLADYAPEIYRLERELERNLRIPIGVCRAKLSTSGHRSGFPMHFDRYDTLQIQLAGKKVWRIAMNRSVQMPLHGHILGLPQDPGLAQYLSQRLPRHIKQHRQVTLRPGSVLYVPRGYWHATAASGFSQSIAIRIGTPAWLSALPPAEGKRLISQKPWRSPSYGAWRGKNLTNTGRRALSKLSRIGLKTHAEHANRKV